MANGQNNQDILKKLSNGEQRLIFLEEEMKANKRLMFILIVMSLIIVVLNRNCK